MDRVFTRQFNAKPASMASSTACRLKTGRAPGSPRHTGHTFVLGGAPKLVGQPQKILVFVASWTCTSKPMTGSYLASTSGPGERLALDGMLLIIAADSRNSDRPRRHCQTAYLRSL